VDLAGGAPFLPRERNPRRVQAPVDLPVDALPLRGAQPVELHARAVPLVMPGPDGELGEVGPSRQEGDAPADGRKRLRRAIEGEAAGEELDVRFPQSPRERPPPVRLEAPGSRPAEPAQRPGAALEERRRHLPRGILQLNRPVRGRFRGARSEPGAQAASFGAEAGFPLRHPAVKAARQPEGERDGRALLVGHTERPLQIGARGEDLQARLFQGQGAAGDQLVAEEPEVEVARRNQGGAGGAGRGRGLALRAVVATRGRTGRRRRVCRDREEGGPGHEPGPAFQRVLIGSGGLGKEVTADLHEAAADLDPVEPAAPEELPAGDEADLLQAEPSRRAPGTGESRMDRSLDPEHPESGARQPVQPRRLPARLVDAPFQAGLTDQVGDVEFARPALEGTLQSRVHRDRKQGQRQDRDRGRGATRRPLRHSSTLPAPRGAVNRRAAPRSPSGRDLRWRASSALARRRRWSPACRRAGRT